MRFETPGVLSGLSGKTSIFGWLSHRLNLRSTARDRLPAGLEQISRSLQLNRTQQLGLASVLAEFQQLIGQSAKCAGGHSADAVIRFEQFDLLPAKPSAEHGFEDTQRRVSETLARFSDWLATLDSRQRAQFRQIVQQRLGLV